MITGIYKYENKINHHIYIGQSIDINKRLREHLFHAKTETSEEYNYPIHAAIRKYGIENFDVQIIEIIDKKLLNEREQYWIKYYDSYHNGYNCTHGGQSGEHNGKEVEIYNLDGEYIKSYSSAREAASDLNGSYSFLQQVLHGIRPTFKGYQAKYKEDDRKIYKYTSRTGGAIPIKQLDDNNNILGYYMGTYDAARKLNLDQSSITKVLKGKLKHHGGFKFEYATMEEYNERIKN